MEPLPSRAMPVCVPSRAGSMRIVATTRTFAPAGWTLTSPNGSTTFLSCIGVSFPLTHRPLSHRGERTCTWRDRTRAECRAHRGRTVVPHAGPPSPLGGRGGGGGEGLFSVLRPVQVHVGLFLLFLTELERQFLPLRVRLVVHRQGVHHFRFGRLLCQRGRRRGDRGR